MDEDTKMRPAEASDPQIQQEPEPEPIDMKPNLSEPELANAGTSAVIPDMEILPETGDAPMVEEDPEDVASADAERDMPEWLAEKASYERVTFNLNTELSETKEQLVSTSAKLKDALAQCDSYARDLNERIRLHNSLDLSRSQLSDKSIDLESELGRLKQERDSRENAVREAVKEKQLLTTEILSLKDQLRNAVDEKTNALLKVEVIEQEKRTLSFEKERSKLDSDVHDQIKIWYVKELGERDSKLAQLRLEIASKELKLQNERFALNNEVKEWQSKLLELERKNEILQDTVDRCNKSIEQTAENHIRQTSAYDTELRSAHNLIAELKGAVSSGRSCIDNLNDKVSANDTLMQQYREEMAKSYEETGSEMRSLEEQLRERDDQISDLKEDLEKANNLLKNKHAVSLNVSELELSTLSPAAAETAKLLKGGMTLTSLMREQARLAGELAAEREKTKILEQHMQELVDDIEKYAPHLMEQKNQLENMHDENQELREQLKDADENRRRLQNAKDSSLRELAFNRVELEKCQRDLVDTTRKNQHLLYVLETDALSREGILLSEEDGRRLFDNVGDLQKVNMQLESELATVKASAVQAAITAQNTEMEQLRSELSNSQQKEHRLAEQLGSLTTTFNALEEQSAKLASLAEDNVSANEAREARLRAANAEAELNITTQKVVRLEESLRNAQDTLQRIERNCDDRVTLNQELVRELEKTNVKLESKFEQQKQIADLSLHEIETFEKHIGKSRKEIDDLRKRENEGVAKAVQLMDDLMKMQSEYSQCRLNLNINEERLKQALSDVARLDAQLEIFRTSSFKEQQLMLSLNEMNARMSRVEAERLDHANTQNDLRQLEYDSLKQSLARANHQLTQAKNDSQIMQTRLEQQLSALRTNLAEKEELIVLNEGQINEMTVRLRAVQSQSIGSENTEDMCPERLKMECQQLKNRVQYLESQTDELKQKLEAAQMSVAQKEEELLKFSSSSNRLESGVKETQRMGEIERNQLMERAQRAEKLNEERASLITQLNVSVLEKDGELTSCQLNAITMQNELNLTVASLTQQNSQSRQQLEDARVALEHTRQNLADKISEYSQYTVEIENLRTDSQKAHSETEIMKKRLECYETEVFAAKEAARLAENMRLSHEQSLSFRLEQAEKEAVRWTKALTERDERLQQIVTLYEDLVKKHSAAAPTDDVVANEGSDSDLLPAISQSHQAVLEFLRAEQASAVDRAMKADVDVMRLKAESREIISERDILRNDVNRLKSQEAINAVLLSEKAELMRRMEELLTLQQQFSRIRTDKENLQKHLSEIQKKNSDLSNSITVESAKSADAQDKVNALTRELDARKREVDVLKQRVDTLNKSTPAAVTQAGSVDQMKQRIRHLEEDVRSKELLIKKLPNLRELAIKYRTQAQNAEKELNEFRQGGSAVPTAASGSVGNQAEISRLQLSVNQLTEKIQTLEADLNAKVNEVQEKEFRLTLLTTKVGKNEELKIKISEKDELIKTLSSEIDKFRSAAPSERLIAHIPTSTAAPPSSSNESVLTEQSSVRPSASLSASSIIDSTLASQPAVAVFSNDSILGLPYQQSSSEQATLQAPSKDSSFYPSSSHSKPNVDADTHLTPGSSIFGKSAPKGKVWPASISDVNSSVDDLISNIGADQSSQVSESAAAGDLLLAAENNDESAGDSRDSAFPVSSTDGKRKRAAPIEEHQEAKRLRASPIEIVTSSEEPAAAASQEYPMEAPEDGEISQDVDREAAPEVDEIEAIEVEDDDAQATDREQDFDEHSDRESRNMENLSDEDVASDLDEDEEEEFDEEEEEDDDDDADMEMIHEEVVLSSDSDEPDDDAVESVGYGDDENDVLLADDYDENSQPAQLEIADNEDREAASAVEEADDEGRVSADGNMRAEAVEHVTGSSAAESGASQPRLRIPIVFDRDDQCSSSNEASGSTAPMRGTAIRGRTGQRGRGISTGTTRMSLQSSNEAGSGERGASSSRGDRGRARGGRRPERAVFRPGKRRGL